MYERICIYSAILLVVFGLSLAPSLGLEVTVNGDGATLTTECDLASSAQFNEKTLGSSGLIYQELDVSGSGDNRLEKTAAGNDYAVTTALEASGTVNSQISTAAFDDRAGITAQTEISGDAGCISSESSTPENDMGAIGWFSGDGGYLSSDLTATASDRAFVGGSADLLGANCFDEVISSNVASGGDVTMKVDGFYEKSSGDLGDFGMLAINRNRQTSESLDKIGDDIDKYSVAGYRWNDNPKIQLYLRRDFSLALERLSTRNTGNAISSAAEAWDQATNQNLFSDSGVIISPFVRADRYDGKNVHAWKSLSEGTIAYSRTWYYAEQFVTGADDVDYNQAVESDVCYNTRYQWDTSGRSNTAKIDVQTIALHELGHTLGLGDLYGDETKEQVMHGYHYAGEIDRDLDAGDIAGIQKLYGPLEPR